MKSFQRILKITRELEVLMSKKKISDPDRKDELPPNRKTGQKEEKKTGLV